MRPYSRSEPARVPCPQGQGSLPRRRKPCTDRQQCWYLHLCYCLHIGISRPIYPTLLRSCVAGGCLANRGELYGRRGCGSGSRSSSRLAVLNEARAEVTAGSLEIHQVVNANGYAVIALIGEAEAILDRVVIITTPLAVILCS